MSATRFVLGAVGLDEVPGMSVVLRVLAVVVAVLFDAIVFAVLYGVLPGVRTPLPVLLRGALVGAVGFELLKLVGTWLIGRTTSNPVYGAFAIMVGLLVWINFVSRITLLAAAWTATADGVPGEPADDDRDRLPEDVAARLERLPLSRIRRRIDGEALLYREQAWLAGHAVAQSWPADETARVRGLYTGEIVTRLDGAGLGTADLAPATKPGSFRDLLHQIRVARRARRLG